MLSKEQLELFDKNGYCILPDILSSSEVEEIKNDCAKIVDEMDPKVHNTVFLSGKDQIGSDDYFLSSGDKIRFFFEKDVFDKNGELTGEKMLCLNKIGHALHWHVPSFKKVTFSKKIKELCQDLDTVDPVVTQGMYIFKNPKIGGEVTSHQDATFLYTEPVAHVYGVWIALEDATEENGCLQFVPASHKGELSQRFKLNKVDPPPFTRLEGDPLKMGDEMFIPVPVKKGSGILIHGLVVHRSSQNHSNKPRPIYTFHFYDQGKAKWSEDNWLQPSKELPFPSVYEN